MAEQSDGGLETHNIARFHDDRASPNTRWLEGCVVQDKQGFIKTGPNLTRKISPAHAGRWGALRIFSRPVCRACLRLAIALGQHEARARQSAKDDPISLVHQTLHE